MVLAAVALVLLANDGFYVQTGAGELMAAESTQVQMVSEDLRVQLRDDHARVFVLFVFRNHGPKTTVTMGFPEFGDSPGPVISEFISAVDGKRVPVKRHVLPAEADYYQAVWTKTVTFEKEQTRVVTVSYRSAYGGDSEGPLAFRYDFETGASWRGTMASLKATIDWSGLTKYQKPKLLLGADPAIPAPIWSAQGPFARVLQLRDLKPTFYLMARMDAGFGNIVINGRAQPFKQFRDYDDFLDFSYIQLLSWETFPPRLERHEVLVTLEWIEKQLKVDRPLLERGRQLHLGGKVYRLERHSKLLRNAVTGVSSLWSEEYVYLSDVVRALGGTYRFDKATRAAIVDLPKK